MSTPHCRHHSGSPQSTYYGSDTTAQQQHCPHRQPAMAFKAFFDEQEEQQQEEFSRLEGSDNWRCWAAYLGIFLASKGLLHTVEPSSSQDTQADTQPEAAPLSIANASGADASARQAPDAQTVSSEDDQQALAYILHSIKPYLRIHLRDCKTARQAWQTLATMYGGPQAHSICQASAAQLRESMAESIAKGDKTIIRANSCSEQGMQAPGRLGRGRSRLARSSRGMKRDCFSCGEEGHQPADCPTAERKAGRTLQRLASGARAVRSVA